MTFATASRVLQRSRFLVMVPLDSPWVYMSHAVLGNRRVYHQEVPDFLALFEEPRRVQDAIEDGIRTGFFVALPEAERNAWLEKVDAFIHEMLRVRYLTDTETDEEEQVRAEVRSRWSGDPTRSTALAAMDDVFIPPLPRRMDDAVPTDLKPVSFVLLGWCFTQSVQPVLEQMAAQRGLAARVTVGFHSDFQLVAEHDPDVTVLQLSHRLVLSPLLDGFALCPPEERTQRIAAATALVERSIDEALGHVTRGLLLVQGISRPNLSPLGLREYRDPPGVGDAIHALNVAARDKVAAHPRAMFVDEDLLIGNHGRRTLLDDTVSTFSHHGALAVDPAAPENRERLASFGVTDTLAMHKLLARAYLDAYEAFTARGAIRVIAVDLDNTLWPGEIADERFTFETDDMSLQLMYGRYGGLHEALRILKERGILLAVCSKNSESDVLGRWRMEKVPLAYQAEERDVGHYLRPADFVRLKINWRPKSENLRELIAELGITPAQLAFIDDHPVERAEVQHAIPGVTVLGDDMNRVREILLADPRFDVLDVSEEARARTRTTRARLERDDARAAAPDHAAFLKSLDVRVNIRRERDASRLPRIVELLSRTNQFNTTTRRLSADEVTALMARDEAAVFSMDVSDRFADYGLIGVAVVDRGELVVFAMSCRVIGLEAEVVLMRHVLEHARAHAPRLHMPFIKNGERNAPATRLFAIPGFEPVDGGPSRVFDFSRHDVPPLPAHVTLRTS